MSPVLANLNDVEALIQIDLSAFPSEPLDRTVWERAVERGDVLVIGQPAVGFLLSNDDLSGRTIVRVGVEANQRRRGLGTKLVETARTGVNLVQLMVDQSNRRAINLYERLGFKIVGEIPSQGRSGYYIMNWSTT
jgi:ribosomal protein S18 acetylase RimI-like enzyme